MKHHPVTGTPLPRGMFYDPARDRYRIVIHRRQTPVWRQYAKTYEEALEQYHQGRKRYVQVRDEERRIRSTMRCQMDSLRNHLFAKGAF